MRTDFFIGAQHIGNTKCQTQNLIVSLCTCHKLPFDQVTALTPPHMGIFALTCTFPTPANDPLLPTGHRFSLSLAPSLSNVPLCCSFSHFYSTSSFLWPLSSFHTEAPSLSPPLWGNASPYKCLFSTLPTHRVYSCAVDFCIFASLFLHIEFCLLYCYCDTRAHMSPSSYLARLLQPTSSLFMQDDSCYGLSHPKTFCLTCCRK